MKTTNKRFIVADLKNILCHCIPSCSSGYIIDHIIDQKQLKLNTLEDFTHALDAYLNKDFEQAILSFKKVLKQDDKDNAAHYYLAKAATYIVSGVDTEWSGVEMMNYK